MPALSDAPTTIDRGGALSGTLAVTAGATAFSFGFVIVKSIGLPAPTLGFYRTMIGAAALGLVATILRVPKPVRWAPLFFTGLFFGAHQLFFIAATQTTSISIVTLISALTPLLVSLAAPRLVAERAAPSLKWLALLAALGVAVVVWANLDHPSRSLEGDLLSVANLFVFAGFFLAAKRARADGTHTLALTVAQTAFAALLILPALAFVETRAPERPAQWLLLTLLALGPGSGHLLVNWAHRRISAALSALILTAIPLLASFWAHLVFDEPFGPRHVVGMVIVAVAIELARRAELRRIPGRSPKPPGS